MSTTLSMFDRMKHARRVSAPIVTINSSDQQATVDTVGKWLLPDYPVVVWDVLRGTCPFDQRDEASVDVAKQCIQDGNDVTVGNPVALLQIALTFPDGTAVIVVNANSFVWEQGDRLAIGFLQGMANLRDGFKTNGRTLFLIDRQVRVPDQMTNDIVALDEPLPTAKELAEIVADVDKAACQDKRHKPLAKEQVDAAVKAVEGLSRFAAEQTVAMALRLDGIDIEHAWQLKQSVIEQTRGLSLYRGGEGFESLGGLSQIKDYLKKVMAGKRRPRVVVWLDEFEKSGVANRNDTSGVNQDQEGVLLQWLQDHNAYGVLCVGVPGCGKSALAKAIGPEFDTIVIRVDLGAMQGSLVGQSQERIRAALKVVEAVGGDETLWLATSNSIDGLSGAMKSRFTDVYFFDLCDQDERKKMWSVQMKRFGLDGKPYSKDEGWVGRNIYQCCDKADRMGVSVEEAGKMIVPVGQVDREQIERLRTQADGRYLSASYPGVYRKPVATATGGRKIGVG